ncbi:MULTISPECIES: TetR/AcrR family transcriptional regulator [unclassified Streptomyces]|uniref:TetR/AcrR family transcriptional regulator n=1 Tax=unclassified Streptomyces TaxID=2593676 RepID=UPI00236573CA|nr:MULTISPECIES: TetR/AcrR family transcriptional regulator [unclassified Streptomyces]MDF3140849.1 TetR/AcrR family transcriptional regulator [Streptomyces sp. T21Q-yed]WDF40362.1 TetR/AcrR family transcriptional regulator [Streptomyces sp. T12]
MSISGQKTTDTTRQGTKEDGELPPRERLVRAASRLFYYEGVRAIGVERLIAEAGVTKATFYRHFAAKDDLVVAYLLTKDAYYKEVAEPLAAAHPPAEAIDLIFEAIAEHARERGFRGSPFLNAAAEYPDADHPVRALVTSHRDWIRTLFQELLTRLGHTDAESAAGALLMLYDGAMAAGYLDDSTAAHKTLLDAVRLIRSGG